MKESEERRLTLLDLIAEKAGSRQVMMKVARAFTQARTMSFASVAQLLERLLSETGYIAWLTTQPDGAERIENIDELFNVTSQYTDVPAFLEQVALMNDVDQLNDQSARVTCMTLHAAKGLEFPYVFLLGCEEGLLPHQNSLDSSAQIEEERRLLYVGITRAQQQLILTHAQRRFIHGSSSMRAPSRFLHPIADVVESLSVENPHVARGQPDSGDSFYDFAAESDLTPPSAGRVGTFIRHPQFGSGVVIEQKGSLLTCIFEGQGIKTIDVFTIEG
jgi:DNA helicase-2/ATP-dependent DNA helicase PcrA